MKKGAHCAFLYILIKYYIKIILDGQDYYLLYRGEYTLFFVIFVCDGVVQIGPVDDDVVSFQRRDRPFSWKTELADPPRLDHRITRTKPGDHFRAGRGSAAVMGDFYHIDWNAHHRNLFLDGRANIAQKQKIMLTDLDMHNDAVVIFVSIGSIGM